MGWQIRVSSCNLCKGRMNASTGAELGCVSGMWEAQARASKQGWLICVSGRSNKGNPYLLLDSEVIVDDLIPDSWKEVWSYREMLK